MEAAFTAVSSVVCGDDYVSVGVDISHASRFPSPVGFVFLHDAETVYPNITNTKVSGYDNSVEESLRKMRQWYSFPVRASYDS
jgi:hypothetical protein